MDVDVDASAVDIEEDAKRSILWLIENAKFLLGSQLVSEILSRINERNEPIFIAAAKQPFLQESSVDNIAARFIRCLDHSQLLFIISTDQFSPSLAWPAIFVLALDRLIAEPNKETAPACRALPPPKQLLYWDTILRQAISRNSAPPKAVQLFLKQLTPAAVTQLLQFALNTTDPLYLLAFNQFYQLVFSETYSIDSFRSHSLIEAICTRFSIVDGYGAVNFDEIFGNTKGKAYCYNGTALLGPPTPVATAPKQDLDLLYEFFFDFIRVNSSSNEKLINLFNKMTASSAVLTNLIKFSIERDSPEHSDLRLLNLIIKSDSYNQLILSDSTMASCLVDRCILIIDTIIKRFKASFHQGGQNSDAGVPIVAQAKFVKAKKLRSRILEASWSYWERSLASANQTSKLVEFLGPPWKDGNGSTKSYVCHSHLAEQARNYILEKPAAKVFKSVDAKLHPEHLRRIATELAAYIGLSQSSMRDVPMAQILMAIEPLDPAGDESNLCTLVFAVLTSLDHVRSFDPFVPENLPGLIIYAAQSARLVAGSPLPGQVVSGEVPYHPFFKQKLNTLKAMASCAYGFDALCGGPIYKSLLNAHEDQIIPASPNTLSLAQHLPRDCKAFILFWLWLRAGPAPSPVRSQASDWLHHVSSLLNDRFRSSVPILPVLETTGIIVEELILTLKTNPQRVWALCATFDVLDKLASLHCFDSENTNLASFLPSCCDGFNTMWAILRARILDGRSDANEPIQHHIVFAASLLRRISSRTLHIPELATRSFAVFQGFYQAICDITPEKLQSLSLDLGYCVAEANVFTETFLRHFFDSADPGAIKIVAEQDIIIVHIVNVIRLSESHEASSWLQWLRSVLLIDGGARLAVENDKFLEDLLSSLPSVLRITEQSLKSAPAHAWLLFHESILDLPVTNLLYSSESTGSAFFRTLFEIAASEDFADEDETRLLCWRLLKRLIISKERPWELISKLIHNRRIPIDFIIQKGVRVAGGTGEQGIALPVSVEIVSSCLEILQFICSKDSSLKEWILENFCSTLKQINECVAPGPVGLLVGLQQDPKAGLKRLLFFVKEILEPDRKKVVQTQINLHRAIPLFIANILSIPTECITAEIFKIIIHISNRACSYQELVFFLHKFQVHTKLLQTTSAALKFKIEPNILGAIKAIASKIGDGSRQAPK